MSLICFKDGKYNQCHSDFLYFNAIFLFNDKKTEAYVSEFLSLFFVLINKTFTSTQLFTPFHVV